MVIEKERCTNCKEKIVPENSVKETINGSTFKFCSQACAEAYKETTKLKGEEIKERQKRLSVLGM